MIPSFPSGAGLPARRLHICIVTFELVGFWKNGGIGTVSTGLAELLAAAGHEVTIAYSRAGLLTDEEFEVAAAHYTAQGIRVVALRGDSTPATTGPLAGFTGWERFAVYYFLMRNHFDIVHASEHLGELYYCISAKLLGVAFTNTAFWVGCHGPSHWVIEANDDVVREPFWIWTDATERFCIAHADVVWAPSRYLLGWIHDNGFTTPEGRTFQQQYRIPDDLGSIYERPAPSRGTRQSVTELVFFGRLETRKGIKLFLDALAELGSELDGRKVTFMGRIGTVDGEQTDAFIARRAARLGIEWQIISGFDRLEAYRYVTEPGRLVVAAAPVDNSPCAVYELLEVKAHMLACRGGGVPELVAPDWHADVLFDYSLPAITERLRHCLAHGSVAPEPSSDRAGIEAAWLGAHLALVPAVTAPVADPLPELVVGVVLYDGDLLALSATVASLQACSETVGEIIFVQSDRRAALSTAVHPTRARLALDAVGGQKVLEAIAARGKDALVLRAGATITHVALARLQRAGRQADAVVPFAQIVGPDGSISTELTLAGCESWAALHGTARIGGLLSHAALRRLADATPLSGSDILLWFDQALALGCTVLPLAEPLLDGTQVDRTTHYIPDERARLTFWVGRTPSAVRMLVEAAYAYVVRAAAALPIAPTVSPSSSTLPAPLDFEASSRYRVLLRSRSFRFGSSLAQLLGRPIDLPTEPMTTAEVQDATQRLLASAAWDLGAPIRLAGRFLRRQTRN